uniref:Uncharacterized protein LOC116948105 n=1 Tax=Petromyzon marinus TaxID=7757 RepID=A0AAJ7TLR3_PETMA|nr:uncharacterized protein LOC116948105 [Petromyzon marinus]
MFSLAAASDAGTQQEHSPEKSTQRGAKPVDKAALTGATNGRPKFCWLLRRRCSTQLPYRECFRRVRGNLEAPGGNPHAVRSPALDFFRANRAKIEIRSIPVHGVNGPTCCAATRGGHGGSFTKVCSANPRSLHSAGSQATCSRATSAQPMVTTRMMAPCTWAIYVRLCVGLLSRRTQSAVLIGRCRGKGNKRNNKKRFPKK